MNCKRSGNSNLQKFAFSINSSDFSSLFGFSNKDFIFNCFKNYIAKIAKKNSNYKIIKKKVTTLRILYYLCT